MKANNFIELREAIKASNKKNVLVYQPDGTVEAVPLDEFNKGLNDRCDDLEKQVNLLIANNNKLKNAIIDIVKQVKELALRSALTEADVATINNLKED